ncbi:hypothetical protein PMM47T1_22443 [Pseudomonas sp. M47T1]|uniref:DUF1365 domain-containing protein n=1 Tax=unclassified Pseudomonas TaxID=196821 RepID=UPI00026068BF|nr:DUF1365 domain-containing protein [Pseudomonas sp. M47T1]EIK94356.1 hypothetical protein PMM47T1_22443 [Pseudomonas sp. M47T1]
MNSALYSGWVSHRRFTARGHQFSYRIGLLYLDLAEQSQVLGLSPLAGKGRWAPFAFRETDYLREHTRTGVPLADAVRQCVARALGHTPQGAIRLLTQARSFGLAFNPVSLFYCFDPQEKLVAILCEVTNTPWRERFYYVLPAQGDGFQHFAVAKAFHVSPFLPRDLEYRMSFSPPGERLGVHMADWQGDTKVFDATLNLHRQAMSRGSLHRQLLAFPWMTAKTCLAIYWQALRLALKRTPIFNHRTADGSFRTAIAQAKERRHE